MGVNAGKQLSKPWLSVLPGDEALPLAPLRCPMSDV